MKQALQEYARQGFVRVAHTTSAAKVGEALAWIEGNRTRGDVPQTKDLLARGNSLPIKVRRLWEVDPEFWQRFVSECGVLPWVDALLGSDYFLIRTAAFIKYPHSSSCVGWHCDEDLWGHPCDAGLTAWIALTPIPVDSGCLQFIPGSYTKPKGRLYWDLSHPYHKVMDVADLGTPVTVSAHVGDCILMDKRSVHSSGANSTARERIGLVLAFARCSAGALTEPAVAVGRGRVLGYVAPEK